ncbi:DapH/DapD/GlmU-related protein [Natroniella sp. ANB-PHB2]|uniref:acyltransferase n=1 Tax=Natroniella sp. ANB-PHB2 TaxID=3384444 RepID=UPI0038D406EE
MNKISQKAKLGENVTVGDFTVIQDGVEIGDNVIIGNNVVIHQGSKIGSNIRIDDNTVIGKQPMKAVTSAVSDDKLQPPCEISDGCLIGANTVIYAGCKIGEKCLVADQASIRENVEIGDKTIIGRAVAVENHCSIGSYCKLETNVYITAYSEVEDHCFIAPGVTTSNDNFAGRSEERYDHFKGVTVKEGGRIGAGATILPGKVIEEDGFVAAGSVVTKDVESKKIVAGTPAKEFGNVPEDQLLENQ